MKNLSGFLLLTFAIFPKTLLASDQSCTVEHFHESATAKVGALICGEFKFDPNGQLPKRHVFEKCENVAVEFTSQQDSSGHIYVVVMSDPQRGKPSLVKGAETTTLMVKNLPSEFRLVRSVPFKNKKHVLSDEYSLNCH